MRSVIRAVLHTAERVPFYSARREAHEWLAGTSWDVALRDLSEARAAEVIVTRPTAPHLVDTVELLRAHGVQSILFRPLSFREIAEDDAVMLIPRFALTAPYLSAARRAAERAGMSVVVSEVPSDEDLARYVRLFGSAEFRVGAPRTSTARVEPIPPPRAGRPPATRLGNIVRQLRVGPIGGDPLAMFEPQPLPEVMLVRIDSSESTRDIRIRLAHAAQEGARTLRVTNAFAHPASPELMRETTRLSFSCVELEGDASGLAQFKDGELAHLKGVTRIEVIGDIDAGRIAELTGAKVEVRA